jgi:hypothetical protein
MEAGFTRLTKARVESLRPGIKQRDIGDPERRGLVLRIEPSGSKSWLFRYKFTASKAIPPPFTSIVRKPSSRVNTVKLASPSAILFARAL